MSVWTHVAGIIRIDDIRLNNSNSLPDFDKLVGKECLFTSPSEIWEDYDKNPDDYMPCGSEGTLEKSVWINPDKSCMDSYTISVFGDLRDYEESQSIINWFIKICDRLGWIRQAVITVYTEGQEPITYTYEEKDE